MTTSHEQRVYRLLVFAAGLMMVVLALLGTGCGSGNSTVGGDYVMTVKRMIEVEGRVDDAIALLEEQSQRSPAAGPTWYWLGIAYHRKGRHQEAVTALDRAFTCDRLRLSETWHSTAYSHRGWAHYHLHDFAKAASDFDDALAVAASPAMRQDALRGRGWVRHQLGRYAEATTDFSEALGLIDTGNRFARADAFTGRGLARLRLREFPGAMSDLDRAVTLTDPGNAALREERLRGLAWARYYLGDFEGALQDVNLALPLIPAGQGVPLCECSVIQAFAYLALGRDQEALEAVDRGKTAGSSLPFGTDRDLALVYLVQGEREKALSLWGGAAWLGVELQNYQEGEVTGAKIISLPPRSPAGAAGLMPNDVIVAIDGQAVANSSNVIEQITPLKPGQTTQVEIARDGARSSLPVTLGSVETLMATLPILAPVLKVRPLPQATTVTATAGGQTGLDPGAQDQVQQTGGMIVFGGSQEQTSGQTTAADAPAPVIKSLTVEPKPVKAGEPFTLTVEVLAGASDAPETELELTVGYAVGKGEGPLEQPFRSDTLKVISGRPKTIVKKMRATKTPGDYTLKVTLAWEGQTASEVTALSVR